LNKAWLTLLSPRGPAHPRGQIRCKPTLTAVGLRVHVFRWCGTVSGQPCHRASIIVNSHRSSYRGES
jgi:hypothetical protein